MKHLKDYQGEDAIELWADLTEPIAIIVADKEIRKVFEDENTSKVVIAKEILKRFKKEAETILLRIDPTPLNGLNVITRIVDIILEILNDSDINAFLSQLPETAEHNASGNATETTMEKGI